MKATKYLISFLVEASYFVQYLYPKIRHEAIDGINLKKAPFACANCAPFIFLNKVKKCSRKSYFNE